MTNQPASDQQQWIMGNSNEETSTCFLLIPCKLLNSTAAPMDATREYSSNDEDAIGNGKLKVSRLLAAKKYMATAKDE